MTMQFNAHGHFLIAEALLNHLELISPVLKTIWNSSSVFAPCNVDVEKILHERLAVWTVVLIITDCSI